MTENALHRWVSNALCKLEVHTEWLHSCNVLEKAITGTDIRGPVSKAESKRMQRDRGKPLLCSDLMAGSYLQTVRQHGCISVHLNYKLLEKFQMETSDNYEFEHKVPTHPGEASERDERQCAGVSGQGDTRHAWWRTSQLEV